MIKLQSFFVFGDSIMKGVTFDSEKKKYVVEATENFESISNDLNIVITNNSKFGCTVDKGYERIIKTFSKNVEMDAAIIEYGGNDCDFNWKEIAENPLGEHKPHTSLADFKIIYKQIIELLRSHGVFPIALTLPPIDAGKYFDWLGKNGLNTDNILTWLGDKYIIYRYQEMYSQAVAEVARDTGCALVDVRSSFLLRRDFPVLTCEDGIHPSKAGQKIIFNSLLEAAEKLKKSPYARVCLPIKEVQHA